MSSVAQLTMHSPVGEITLSEADGAIVSLDWGRAPPEFQAETPLLKQARDMLNRYFDGDFSDHNLPLAPPGTAFQQKVWQAMRRIPAGRTQSYGELAQSIDSAARAVGQACGANPIPILIPCHRVLAAGGSIGGYSGDGGAETKRALLRLEGALP